MTAELEIVICFSRLNTVAYIEVTASEYSGMSTEWRLSLRVLSVSTVSIR
jgi:hypothetical protein